ncbi:MAG TPA: S-layer homology domain-containing protein [Acidimicrobiia bacterium]
MSHRRQIPVPQLIWTVVGALTLVLGIPLTVIASHQFNDVPDSNTFHNSIAWLADNRITLGCNPPANTNFCPNDAVTRGQMAAFLRRQAQAYGNVGSQVTSAAGNIGLTTAAFVVLSSVEVTPKAQAAVTLSAHAALEKSTSSNGTFMLRIARNTCNGTVVGAARWRANTNADGGGSFEAITIPLTGSDVISSPVTYVLCGAKADVTLGNANVFERGLTATWSPTA